MEQLCGYTITNPRGWTAEVLNYGATIQSIKIITSEVVTHAVVAGFDRAQDYRSTAHKKSNLHFGATIGRFAGRMGSGGFTIDEVFYPLETNDKGIQLHGGPDSIDTLYWQVADDGQSSESVLELTVCSPSGHNGFPGNVQIKARFEWQEDTFRVTYTAKSDQATVFNMTNHAYFNLNGSVSIKGHQLTLSAGKRLVLDQDLLPTGAYASVQESPYDFRQGSLLDPEPINGWDTPFVLEGSRPQAVLYSKHSGIRLAVTTNQPGLVVFTPRNFTSLSSGHCPNASDWPAICLECQNFPDAPNQPHFPSAVLRPGHRYEHKTDYYFSFDSDS